MTFVARCTEPGPELSSSTDYHCDGENKIAIHVAVETVCLGTTLATTWHGEKQGLYKALVVLLVLQVFLFHQVHARSCKYMQVDLILSA